MVNRGVRPDVLGRLLVIPSMLDVLPGLDAIAQFLQSALTEIPGVASLFICVDGVIYPTLAANSADALTRLNAEQLKFNSLNFNHLNSDPSVPTRLADPVPVSEPGADANPEPDQPDQPDQTYLRCAIVLATSRHQYGYLMIAIANPQQFTLYEPYIRNLANILATVIENRAFIDKLQQTNNRLTEVNDHLTDVLEHLEQRVEERTHVLSQEIQRREALETALRASETKYRTLLATTSEGFWLLDRNLHIIELNQSLCTLLGYAPEELLGKTPFDLVHEPSYALLAQQMQHIATTPHRHYELQLVKKDGTLLYTSIHATTLRTATGEVEGAFAFLTDISDRKRAEARLKLAASVFTHSREGIFITDAQGTILEINDAFSQITGYPRDEVIGRSMQLVKCDRQHPEGYTALWEDLQTTGAWSGELWNRRKDQTPYAELLTISGVRDEAGQIQSYVALFSDITAQKQHEQKLEHTAHYDALTNLPNRILLGDRLHQAMLQVGRRGQQIAVVYLDLDGFKAVNDAHGHDMGDRLLQQVACRLKQAVRDGDTVARLGGDEFVAILLDLEDESACLPILHRLLQAAADPVPVGDRSLHVSASVGVTFYPQSEPISAEDLICQADAAMYQAKLSGKNRYHRFP